MESSKKEALGEVLIQAQQSRILGARESLWIATVKKLSRQLSQEMVSCEIERAVGAAMTVARVRTKKILKIRDEIMSKAYKGLF